MAKANAYPEINLVDLTGNELIFTFDPDSGKLANNILLSVLTSYVEQNITETVTDASNVGATGVGLFKGLNASILEFFNLRAISSRISVFLNPGTNTVDLDVNEAALTLNNLGGTLGATKGGTGVTTVPTNGQIFIGNGSGYVVSTLTAGNHIFINNSPGSIEINSSFAKGHVYAGNLEYLTSTTVTVQSGEFRDNADTFDIVLPASGVINLGTVGVNGLDVGVQTADTWYASYIIADSNGVNPTATLASLSFTTPSLPVGYDKSFYSGVIRSNSVNALRLFTQTGKSNQRKYYWEDDIVESTFLINGNAIAFTPVSLASIIPITSTEATLNFLFDTSAGGASATDAFYLRRTGSTITIVNSINSFSSGVKSQFFRDQSDIITDSSQSIDYAVDNASDTLTLSVFSFKEEL